MRGWDDALKREGRMLESCSHKSVLNRGFALVRDAEGRVVEDPTGVAPGTPWSLEFRDGKRADVTVRGNADGESPTATKRRKKLPRARALDGQQGSLF